jgi:cell division septation protein DedD
MAASGRSSGLTIGQLLSLTVGFLAASVLIFFFGLWVGRDLAEQRISQETEIIRIPVLSPTPGPTSTEGMRVDTPTAALRAPVATPTALVLPVAPTATPRAAPPTPTQRVTAATPAQAAGVEWTVQASATTDPVQAVVLARRLRARGYDAFTTQGPIAGVTWYRIQVGKFTDRAAASRVETKLRREEGLEAAYVTRLVR